MLMKELQSLGLDIKALDENKNVLELRESEDDLPGTQEVNIDDEDAAEDTGALMGEGGEDMLDEDIMDEFDMEDDLADIDDDMLDF